MSQAPEPVLAQSVARPKRLREKVTLRDIHLDAAQFESRNAEKEHKGMGEECNDG